MTNGAPPPVPGTAPTPKKGLSPLAWIGIGCGALVLVGLVAVFGLGLFAVKKGQEMVTEATGSESFRDFVEDMQQNPAKTAAETMIRMNPDLEIVSTDDEAGTITFTNNKTGEEATLNFEDIAEGRFSMTTDEGEYRIDAADEGEGGVTFTGPEGQETRWGGSAGLDDVPDWVPIYPDATDVQGTYSSVTAQGVSGIVNAKTGDPPKKVVAYYKEVLDDRGYVIQSETTNTTPQGDFSVIMGELAAEGRTLNVTATDQGRETQVHIQYNGKNQGDSE